MALTRTQLVIARCETERQFHRLDDDPSGNEIAAHPVSSAGWRGFAGKDRLYASGYASAHQQGSCWPVCDIIAGDN